MIIYKTEEEFEDNCSCSCQVGEFVKTIQGENKWYFHSCVCRYDWEDSLYHITYKSYEFPPEYANFELIIKAEKQGENWNFSVVKQATELIE